MRRQGRRHRVGREVVDVPGFPHFRQTPGGEVAENGGHVEVFLDGSLQEAAAQRPGEQFRLLTANERFRGAASGERGGTYGLTTLWSIRSILFWTITVGISPHSFST